MILTGLLLVSGHWVFVSLDPHATLVYCATRWHLHFSTNPTQFHIWTTNIHTHTHTLTHTRQGRTKLAPTLGVPWGINKVMIWARLKYIIYWLKCPALQKVLIVISTGYPHLVLNDDFSYFYPAKVDPLKLESQNIPVVLPSTPTKIWGKSVQVLKSYDLTYIQTNTQTEITITTLFQWIQ